MDHAIYGRVLQGEAAQLDSALQRFQNQPVDWEWMPVQSSEPDRRTTIGAAVNVTGPGTYFRRAQRTLYFEPTTKEGWWFDRTDLPESLPIRVTAANVWTTQRNIVLCSGSPHNYMRMVEHIVALKRGLSIDNLMIRMNSGDPPLFERGSLDLVEAFDRAGLQMLDQPASYVTVRQPVSIAGPRGSFLIVRPCTAARATLDLDVAVDFQTAIRQQRLRIRLTPETARYGAPARTNCTYLQMLLARSAGTLFADTRNMGYTNKNILIAGRHGYVNQPRMEHNGKALEAVWHRTILDLLAAIALIDGGRFVGEVWSYKSGHSLDVNLVRHLDWHDLLTPFHPTESNRTTP